MAIVNEAQNNTIGDGTSGGRNVIAGNGGSGVYIGVDWKGGAPAHDNLVIGNYIGTNAAGTAALGNHEAVEICDGANNNIIGGTAAGEKNVIAAGKCGVHLCNGATSNQILGNYVGTNAAGTAGLANGGGVGIDSGAQRNTIGPGNLIAYNANDGVAINGTATLSNTITRNSVHSNTGPGINNSDGGNRELLPPVISPVRASGSITGTACANCTVEVFSDAQDEGRVYEGSTIADGSGHFSFHKPAGFTGPNLTATATDAGGNTSEFSSPVSVPHFLYLPLVLRSYRTR